MTTNLAENLKKIRKDHNLSQEQLAEELKVSRQAISKWESGNTYPEMDKILQICNKFNININDLLNNDIREVNSEQESKKNINKYIDDFLNFITNTFNMFINFSYKTKVKCIFEQIVILIILLILFAISGSLLNSIFSNMIRILPDQAFYVITGIVDGIFSVISIILGTIIWLHIFRTRYTDYYIVAKEENIPMNQYYNDENKTKASEESMMEINKKNEKIVLRDPKHSEYKFINGLFKSIVVFIKICAFALMIFIGFILIGLFAGLASSFLIVKTGLFFLGILLVILGSIIVTVIVELILLNFVFNRKNEKKLMIWLFLGSLLLAGVGSGLIFIGSLDFEMSDGKELLVTKSVDLKMYDNLVISNMISNDIEFIESKDENVRIEYKLNKYSSANYEINDYSKYKQLYIYTDHTEIFKMIKEYFNYLNDKKVLDLNSEITDIKINASKENINKIRDNIESMSMDNYNIRNYETEIQNLENRISEYESTINELNTKLDLYENQSR